MEKYARRRSSGWLEQETEGEGGDGISVPRKRGNEKPNIMMR